MKTVMEILEILLNYRHIFVLPISIIVFGKVISFVRSVLMEDSLDFSELPKPKISEEKLISIDVAKSIEDGTFDSEKAAQAYADYYYRQFQEGGLDYD